MEKAILTTQSVDVPTFAELGVDAALCRALAACNYTQPTPIQQKAIPLLLQGRDLLGVAQTGTGKTAAFAVPMLQILATPEGKAPGALILAPTRELAIQIGDDIAAYGKFMKLRHTVIFGGVSQHSQVNALRRGLDILVATPGRLLDLMEQGHVDLRDVQVLVLDEADRMLDMGFIRDVRKIVAKLPEDRQSLLFSATMPGEVAKLAQDMLHKPVRVDIAPKTVAVEAIRQSVHFVGATDKPALLRDLLADPAMQRVIVFTRTKHRANRVAEGLEKAGVGAAAIHGNKSQGARQRALEDFRSGAVRVLVATDIAARGIDVPGVSHVVNFELPNEPESYVHRIGRTARAGADGAALSLCDASELDFLRDIERLIGREIETAGGERPSRVVPLKGGRNGGNRGGRQGSAAKAQQQGASQGARKRGRSRRRGGQPACRAA